MATMLDSVNPAEIRRAIANGARPDALLGYSDGRFDDYLAIAAEAGGLPVYALDVLGNPANAQGEDTEPGNIDIPGAVRCLLAEKARGVDRPIGYCPESQAVELVAEAARQGLSGSLSAAGRTDWRLLAAHYGKGWHICGPATCGCPVEANGTQCFDSGPHGENVDQSLLDDQFLTAAPHPGPTPARQEDPMAVIHLAPQQVVVLPCADFTRVTLAADPGGVPFVPTPATGGASAHVRCFRGHGSTPTAGAAWSNPGPAADFDIAIGVPQAMSPGGSTADVWVVTNLEPEGGMQVTVTAAP